MFGDLVPGRLEGLTTPSVTSFGLVENALKRTGSKGPCPDEVLSLEASQGKEIPLLTPKLWLNSPEIKKH